MNRRRVEPGPGEESVWAYPRPPKLEETNGRVEVFFGGAKVADTTRAKRVRETSHPPVYYVPPEDVRMEYLVPAGGRSFCEWKGVASYYDIRVGGHREARAAWYYPSPTPPFVGLEDHVAFYPSLVDACYVDGEKVRAQEGDFYGGWITSGIVGPFKGGPGTRGW